MLKITLLLCFVIFISKVYALDVLVTADEVSNTVSIVDAETFKLLDIVALGPEKEYALKSSVSPLIQNNVHGLSLSPDKKTMVITSNISNSVVLYDVENLYKPLKYFNVGLSPHIATFRPDGKEIWVANRGTSSVDIIDVKTMQMSKPLAVSLCPSFFAFLTKKPIVFISSTCTKNLEIFNTNTKRIIKTLTMNGAFSPLLALTPDQKEVWVIRKDSEEVLRVDTEKMEPIESVHVGNYPQHIAFIVKDGATLGAVTVGGENSVKFFKYVSASTTPAVLMNEVKVPGIPHGIVAASDFSNVYTATEFGDELFSISLNNMKVVNSVKIGNSPQSLLYVQNFKKNPLSGNDLSLKLRDSNTDTINILFSSNSTPIKGASMSMRITPRNIHTTFGVFGSFPEKDEFKFYLSKAVKSIKDIGTSDKILIGYAFCKKGTITCLNYSSMTQDFSLIEKVRDKNYKVFATNVSETIFLMNQ